MKRINKPHKKLLGKLKEKLLRIPGFIRRVAAMLV
jgi:hypothetical protein